MRIITYFGEGFDCNSYLAVSGNEAVLVDCAVLPDRVSDDLRKEGALLKYIILTHGHFDHILTLDEVRQGTGARVLIHECDGEMLTDSHKNGYSSFFRDEFCATEADATLRDGDCVSVGDTSLRVIHTPGHSKGSMCLEWGGALFTGDTLFANNIGRSDLYGGDGAILFHSLKKLTDLPQTLDVYPGHGPVTTLEREVRGNYYIRDALSFE